ncbi:TlpA family protein disulfide reductase [Singulisphaera sp. PoT]|uniref:TlpA family protein disulfide reductase n=1 Tax=Singulisphaera sp. PoT TaxID=3411797 RepID=UPI003BF55310
MRNQRVLLILGTRVFRRGGAGLALLAACSIAAAPGEPAPAPKSAVLNLSDGGFVAGEIKDSDKANVVRWQADAFVAPFEFDLKSVQSLAFPSGGESPKPTGDYCFELAGGGVLYGSLAGLDDKVAVLEIPNLGQLHVERSQINRIQRWNLNADLIYLGPNGLEGWQASPAANSWREETGQIVTSTPGTSIRKDLGLPSRATIEFELSWKDKPDFLLALGVDGDEKNLARAFRFEAWGKDIVVHREAEDEADVVSVGQVENGAGRIHLVTYLDQEKSRLVVYSPSGARLADMKVAPAKPMTLPGIYLGNIRGDVRLERLQIGRWNGEAPRDTKADQARVHRNDGSTIYGQISKYDPSTREFVVRQDTAESRIKADEIGSVFLSFPADQPARAVVASFRDGTRLSGDLNKVEDGKLWLSVPGIEEKVGRPLKDVGSLVVLRSQPTPTDKDAENKPPARLETEGTRISGKLEDGREQGGATCLVWHPLASATGSPLKAGASARIIYKEPPPPAPKPDANPNVVIQRQAQVGALQGFLSAYSGNQLGRQGGTKPRALHLRTGDVIPCEVLKIDETGVSIRTPVSESALVPHDKIKAAELAPESVSVVKLTRSKRDRLLTLPRMQKESPPLQLIRSKNGDYLRGRVVKMDDENIELEVRLETKQVPRNRVARIIWLHPDEIEGAKKPDDAKPSPKNTLVQAVRNDGTRMTFHPKQVEGKTLSGQSDVLGLCKIGLDEVDQLLIGSAIDKEVSHLAYQQWKLRNAPEPKFVKDDGGSSSGGENGGTESPLVGKPAPDFTLDLLEGKKFHLAEAKGKVVVLDFWATWCGPCLQAMPQVEKVAHEFEDQGVQLVAVNLQEDAKAITSMLERHKLKVTVALDKTGAVAEKYAATAIPQTVVIAKDGTISRLFVGGGPHLEDSLRNAIRPLLGNATPEEGKK